MSTLDSNVAGIYIVFLFILIQKQNINRRTNETKWNEIPTPIGVYASHNTMCICVGARTKPTQLYATIRYVDCVYGSAQIVWIEIGKPV